MNNLAHKFIVMVLEALYDLQGFIELWIGLCRMAARAAA